MENKPLAKSKEDLIGKHIITIGGYSYGGLRKFISDPANNIVSEPAKTHKAAFEMLVDSRADYLVDYASAADHILSRNPVKGPQRHDHRPTGYISYLIQILPRCRPFDDKT